MVTLGKIAERATLSKILMQSRTFGLFDAYQIASTFLSSPQAYGIALAEQPAEKRVPLSIAGKS
jgi:hypothetical protein